MNGSVIIVGNYESPLKRGDFWGALLWFPGRGGFGGGVLPASGCTMSCLFCCGEVMRSWGQRAKVQEATLKVYIAENQIASKKDLKQLSLGPVTAVALRVLRVMVQDQYHLGVC